MKLLTLHILVLVFLITACSGGIQDGEESATITFQSINDSSQTQPRLPAEFENHFDPIDVSYDTNHVKINTADLKVTLLLKNHYYDTTGNYGPMEKKRTDLPEIDFGESLLWGTKVTSIGNALYVSGTVCIKSSGAYYNKLDGRYSLDRDTISTFEFQNYHNGANISYEMGQLEVIPAGMTCMDTGKNKIAFMNEIGRLELGELNNLKLFEFDLNQDKNKEIYVVSYATCMQFMTIYRIENRTI